MKRLLSIIGAISLVGTSTTSLVACNKTDNIENKENNKPEFWIPQELPKNSNWKLITDYYS